MQADAGTITEEDIKFIKTIRADIPKLIIVNKADKKNLEDLQEIIAKIRLNLELKGILFVDVCAFSCKSEQIEDDALSAYIEADTAKIRKQIAAWNEEVYESNFARNFKELFVRCRDFYEDEIDEENQRLWKLNLSLTKLTAEDIDEEVLEPLQQLVRDAQGSVNELKNVSRQLKELQDAFFTEIKYISDIVGIAMPEPSEIDLLQEKNQSPLRLLEAYLKEKGIKADSSVESFLEEAFRGIKPVINKKAGGGEYASELAELITNSLAIDSKDIRINDLLRGVTGYTGGQKG